MQTDINMQSESLPNFLLGLAHASLQKKDLEFEPIQTNGRSSAEVHWLFKAEQADGSAAAVIRYYPGGVSPPHEHTGYELIYMLEGEMKTSTGVVKENDLILLEPGSVHSSSSEKGCLALIVWQKAVVPVSEK